MGRTRAFLLLVLAESHGFQGIASSGRTPLVLFGHPGNIEIRKAEVYGEDALGVFAKTEIAKDTFLGEYTGELLDLEELLKRHPSGEPEYAFRISETQYLDAEYTPDSAPNAWTKRMNHAHSTANVRFDIIDDKVLFYAKDTILKDSELCFDYGEEFWDGRSSIEQPLNDDRIFSTLPFNDTTILEVPISFSALSFTLRTRDASIQQKRAAIMRALDYFGVSISKIPLPPRFFLFWRPMQYLEYKRASLRQLARALRYQLRLADRDLSLDDDE